MPKKKNRRALPQLINFTENEFDWIIARYGELGLQADTIARLTGYTVSQVRGRLRRAGIFLRDYRKGKSVFSKRVMEDIDSFLSEREVTEFRVKLDRRRKSQLAKERRARASTKRKHK